MERLTYRGKGNKAYCDYEIRDIINKLAYYENLEENGLLLILPCSPGTTVYEIVDDCHFWGDCHCKRMCQSCDYRDLHIEPTIFGSEIEIVSHLHSFGKTIFLQETQANEKLQELTNQSRFDDKTLERKDNK